MDEFDIGEYSLYNEQNIIFLTNSVFKCLNVDKINKKVILEFIRKATWDPLRNKEVKFINDLTNLRELEIYDDETQKLI